MNLACAGPRRPNMHLDRLVGLETLVHVGGDLRRQFVAGLGQHARHVEGHVADTDHGDLLGLQRPGAREVRVPVVPGHELAGAVAAVELDAGISRSRSSTAPVEKIAAS